MAIVHFLADDAMIGKGVLDQPPHRLLGLPVGDGDRALVRFGADFHGGAEIFHDYGAGGVGDPFGQFHEWIVRRRGSGTRVAHGSGFG